MLSEQDRRQRHERDGASVDVRRGDRPADRRHRPGVGRRTLASMIVEEKDYDSELVE
jgi:hypothetical protein